MRFNRLSYINISNCADLGCKKSKLASTLLSCSVLNMLHASKAKLASSKVSNRKTSCCCRFFFLFAIYMFGTRYWHGDAEFVGHTVVVLSR